MDKGHEELTAKTATGTQLFLIDDEGIVYAHPRQEIYALNTAATYLWCLIEDGLSTNAILRRYATDFGVSDDTAAAHVSGVMDNLVALGLVDIPGNLAPSPAPVSKPVIDYTPPDNMPSIREAAIVAERSYKLIETEYRVRYSAANQAEWVDPILTNFAVPTVPAAPTVVDVQHDAKGIYVYRDGRPVGSCDALNALAPLIKFCLWIPAINNYDYFMNLHAGVVACGEGCLVLPAEAGSGKSSTTAALVHCGFPYLSDEVALLTEDCTIRPLPLAMCFKSTGWDVVSGYFSEIDALPAHRRGDGKIVKYLSLPAKQRADAGRRYPVKAIIFPKYTPGLPNRFEPLSKTQALDKLFGECVSIQTDLTAHKVSRLADWIKTVDCYTLEFSNLDAAAAEIRASLGV